PYDVHRGSWRRSRGVAPLAHLLLEPEERHVLRGHAERPGDHRSCKREVRNAEVAREGHRQDPCVDGARVQPSNFADEGECFLLIDESKFHDDRLVETFPTASQIRFGDGFSATTPPYRLDESL